MEAKCEICGKVFSKPSALKAHKRMTHAVSGFDSSVELAELKAKLATYEKLDAKMGALAATVNERLLPAERKTLALAEPSADKPGSGLGWLLALLGVGAALWANTTESGQRARASSAAIRAARGH